MLIANRQRQDAEWILDEFKKTWTDNKSPLWGYYLYLMTLMDREPAYIDRTAREIELIFRENPDSDILFWILLFLKEQYYNNSFHKLKAIENWVGSGCITIYLYRSILSCMQGTISADAAWKIRDTSAGLGYEK